MASKPSYTLSSKIQFAYTLTAFTNILLSVIIGIAIEQYDSIKYVFIMILASAWINIHIMLLHVKAKTDIFRRFIEIMMFMLFDIVVNFLNIIILTQMDIDVWQAKLSLGYSIFHCLFSLCSGLYCIFQPKLF